MADPTTYRTNRDLFSNHYLNDHLRETEPWNEVSNADVEATFEEIRELYDDREERISDYNESQLEKNFIRPIFEILNIPYEVEQTVMRNARRPDYGFFPSEAAVDSAFDRENFYEEAIAVADAKRWGRKLDTRGEEKRDFENPSYQIHRYLQETPTQWAVLTNGESWRLYYGPTSHRLDSFYEINLPDLLDAVAEDGDLEAFKEFYLFFRKEAFLPDQSGDCFLDDVYDESSVFAEELGEDLQENIYEAIRVLAEGFLDTNDDLDEDDLELIHDSSLIYLYRLIFVLYAESEGRNLLPTDNEIYSGSYSLNELKQTVVENRSKTQQQYQTWQTNLWDRLDELFVLIDQGSQGQNIPKSDLYIPAYNGGLFRTSPDADDSDEAQFLAEYEAGDAYIAEVIELLTRHDASEGDGKVFVDYSSLDERNLGSIYEGLLEYKLDVADEPLTVEDGEYVAAGEGNEVTVEEGEVYLRTDDGERKATGSYYTPEYVVEYIVDETLGPLVDEIREDLVSESADTTHGRDGGFAERFADQIFDLTVLDPAMGSGHFPVNAVDYLAREIIDAQEQQDRQAIDAEDAEVRPPMTEEGELRDINWARRKVAQRCIYGVDVNPLATELSKVSLWLRTLAAEQPLAFLDHHLKTGNSLVGSDIEDVLTDGDDSTTEDGQLTLQQSFDHTRKRAMEHVTDRFQDLLNIDNETLEDAKEMEAVYDDVRADPLYKKLLAMANVHTADAFGLDVPGDADERMARALHSDAWEKIEQQDWFKSAQAMAEDERFFHWELEFPIAFYDQDGERKTDAGFDAVIGNPPWVNVGRMKGKPAEADYYTKQFKTAEYQVDLYTLFLERGMNMLSKGSPIGFIVPDPWLANYRTPKIREFLLMKNQPRKIIHTPKSAFPEVGAEHLIYIGESSDEFEDPFLRGEMGGDAEVEINDEFSSSLLREEDGYVVYTHSTVAPILNQIESRSRNLGSLYETIRGVGPYHHSQQDQEIIDERAYHADKKEDDTYVPELKGKHLSRYNIQWAGDTWISYGPWLAEPREKRFFEGKRLLLREILGERFEVDVMSEEFVADRGIYIALQGDQKIDLLYALALLGSKVSVFWFREKYSENDELFPKLRVAHFEKLPIRDVQFEIPEPERNSTVEALFSEYQSLLDGEMDREKMRSAIFEYTSDDTEIVHDLLVKVAEEQKSHFDDRNTINLELLDYLGNYKKGPNLPDIGTFQPASPEYLDATSEDYKNLRVGDVRTVLEDNTVTVKATARYKPEHEDEYKTDQWGYRETDYETAFSVTNLSDEEAALVEAFIPVAVDEAGGFAGFRETATKTNSLSDRLKAMQLPDPDDVVDDLRRYVDNRERAVELDEKIKKTDQLIDEIVYDLYDLTDEEIEIVEEAVDDD